MRTNGPQWKVKRLNNYEYALRGVALVFHALPEHVQILYCVLPASVASIKYPKGDSFYEAMQFQFYSPRNGFKAGALGGVIGALVLGGLAGLSAFVLDQEVFYVTIARKVGLADPQLTGWIVHFIVGLVAGAVFIAITALIKRFALDTRRKSFWVGLLGGIAIWVVVYVPVADLFAPTDLSDPMFAGGSLMFHLVYGVVTALTSLWLIRRSASGTTLTRPSN